MKFSIKQHREHLFNMETSLEVKRSEMREREKNVARLALQCDRLRFKIEEAERLRKDGFDEDKFLKILK